MKSFCSLLAISGLMLGLTSAVPMSVDGLGVIGGNPQLDSNPQATPSPKPPAQSSCKRLTAAIGTGQDYYLFFGDTYVKLDDDMKQNMTGNTYDFLGVRWPTAAFKWSVDFYVYIFSGNYYYSRWSDFRAVPGFRFGGEDHEYYFRYGLDAAGNINGRTIFIKGCTYVVSLKWSPSDPIRLPYGSPCYVDAALTVGDELWLFKDDKLWKMNAYGVEDGMPVDTSSVIKLDDIRLCRMDERKPWALQ